MFGPPVDARPALPKELPIEFIETAQESLPPSTAPSDGAQFAFGDAGWRAIVPKVKAE